MTSVSSQGYFPGLGLTKCQYPRNWAGPRICIIFLLNAISIWRSLVQFMTQYKHSSNNVICHNIRKCWEVSLSESLVVWLLWFEVWHQIRFVPIVPSTNDVRRSSLDRTLQWEYFHNFPSSVAGVNDFFFCWS